jgi:hypothetical protein
MPPDDQTTAVVLPPRPNPGPEPWPEPPVLGPAAILLLAGLWLALGAWWRLRRRSRPEPGRGESRRPPEPTMPALAERVRDALVERLGPSWKARTTEEVAERIDSVESLTAGEKASLVAFLRAADRTKFAGEPDQGAFWADWVAAFVEGSAGASSTINGKWSEPMSGPSRRETTAQSGETKT